MSVGYWSGKKLSEEHKAKIRQSLMGHEVAESTRRKQSEIAQRQGRRPSSEASAKGRRNRPQGGPAHWSWKTGKSYSNGYRVCIAPNHPRVRGKKTNYVYEHILVAEEKIGRYLLPDEVVHHIDGDKTNNDPGNLLVCANQAEHMLVHAQQELQNAYEAGFVDGLAAKDDA